MGGTQSDCQAVMLIGFGGPTAPAEVRPFLDRVLAGRPVPPDRYEEVVRHYEALGGRSPYNEMTMQLRAALEEKLAAMGYKAPVVNAFRNMPPFFDDALRELQQRGIRRVLGFVLAAHRSQASWERYLDDLRRAREPLGADAPEVIYPPPWHADPRFIEAVAARVLAAEENLTPRGRARVDLIFTAHSIPLLMNGRAGYVEQLNESARLVARQLGRTRWTLAFQSRSGSPREPWLAPDVREVLRNRPGADVLLVPLGFLCDHVEVLYDLDIEAAEIARAAGATMVRAATAGTHPRFVEMIASIAAGHLPGVPSGVMNAGQQ